MICGIVQECWLIASGAYGAIKLWHCRRRPSLGNCRKISFSKVTIHSNVFWVSLLRNEMIYNEKNPKRENIQTWFSVRFSTWIRIFSLQHPKAVHYPTFEWMRIKFGIAPKMNMQNEFQIEFFISAGWEKLPTRSSLAASSPAMKKRWWNRRGITRSVHARFTRTHPLISTSHLIRFP